MTLSDMKEDGSQLEQGDSILFEHRNLSKRLKREVSWLLHLLNRHKEHIARLACLLSCDSECQKSPTCFAATVTTVCST